MDWLDRLLEEEYRRLYGEAWRQELEAASVRLWESLQEEDEGCC